MSLMQISQADVSGAPGPYTAEPIAGLHKTSQTRSVADLAVFGLGFCCLQAMKVTGRLLYFPVNGIKHWKFSPSPALQLHFIYAMGIEFSFPIEIDPPKNLRVSDVTHSTGVVTWTPPAAQIDGYALTYQGQDGTSKVQWIPLSCRPHWNHPYDYGQCRSGLVGIWTTEKQLWEGIYSIRSPGRESLREGVVLLSWVEAVEGLCDSGMPLPNRSPGAKTCLLLHFFNLLLPVRAALTSNRVS